MKLNALYTRLNVFFLSIAVFSFSAYSIGVIASGVLMYDLYSDKPEIEIVQVGPEVKLDAMKFPFVEEDIIFTSSGEQPEVSVCVPGEALVEGFENFDPIGSNNFSLATTGKSFVSTRPIGTGGSALSLSVSRDNEDEPSMVRYRLNTQMKGDFETEITLMNTVTGENYENSSYASLDVQNGDNWISIGREQRKDASDLVIQHVDISTGEVLSDLRDKDYDLKESVNLIIKFEKVGNILTAYAKEVNERQFSKITTFDLELNNSDIYITLAAWDNNKSATIDLDNFKYSCK